MDVSDASYTTTTTEVDNVAERNGKMKNRDEITGEQNVNRSIAIMQQQLVRDVTWIQRNPVEKLNLFLWQRHHCSQHFCIFAKHDPTTLKMQLQVIFCSRLARLQKRTFLAFAALHKFREDEKKWQRRNI